VGGASFEVVAATTSATALLFPGQGSQTRGMHELVSDHRPDLLALAVEELGENPFPLINEGTCYAQPAMYCANLACWERSGRPTAGVIAGHSLGELAALVAAGRLDAEDGLRISLRRGRLMHEAAQREPGGGMLALLGDDRTAGQVARECELGVANDNAPGQIVLTGPGWKLDAARARAREAGLKAMKLAVGGPFHSPAMSSILPDFRAELARIEFRPSGIEVYSSTTASPFSDIRAQLTDALVQPVRWRQTLTALHRLGIRRFREVGPGEVLTKLVRRTLEGVEASSLDIPEAAHA
jgi:[acyl-carrier-protein] S-malonyltransferase